MTWINYEKKYKFFLSFGIFLILVGLLAMVAYLWVFDQTTRHSIDVMFKTMEFGGDNINKTFTLKSIYSVEEVRMETLKDFYSGTRTLSYGFLFAGFGLAIFGILCWPQKK